MMKIEELPEKRVYRTSNIYHRNITCTIRLSLITVIFYILLYFIFTVIFFKTK